MENLNNVEFKIQDINTERSLDGNSTIKARVVGHKYIVITIKVRNRDANKFTHVRNLLLDEYRKYLAVNKPSLKVGDVL